jgi:hypothetical protein
MPRPSHDIYDLKVKYYYNLKLIIVIFYLKVSYAVFSLASVPVRDLVSFGLILLLLVTFIYVTLVVILVQAKTERKTVMYKTEPQ